MTASIETRLYLRCDGTNIWSGFYTTSPDIKAGLFDNILPELWVNCGDWLGRIELRFEVPQ